MIQILFSQIPQFRLGEYISAAGSFGPIRAIRTCSIRSKIRAAQLPNRGKIRFVHKKADRLMCRLSRVNSDYVDRFDNIWQKPRGYIIGEFHWDVQLSARGKHMLGRFSNSDEHINVTQDGRICH